MFNSGVIDVAIGMIFVYLILSLITSAANEVIELRLKNRASDLEKGIRELVEPGLKAGEAKLVEQIYNHPLVSGLFGGTYSESGIEGKAGVPRDTDGNPTKESTLKNFARIFKTTNLPSYIPSRNFALALMDLAVNGKLTDEQNSSPPSAPLASPPAGPLQSPPGSSNEFTIQALREALLRDDSIIPASTRRGLLTLLDSAETDATNVRENIENWFNSSMDRVSGWYKRRSQKIVLVLGFFVAFAVNADSVLIAKRLVADKSLRESLVVAADEYARANANASPTPTPDVASTSDSKPPAVKQPSKNEQPDASNTGTPATGATDGQPSSPQESPSISPPTPSVSIAATVTPAPKTETPSAGTASDPNASPSVTPTPTPSAKCYPKPEVCKANPGSPQCKFNQSLCDIEALGLPIGWSYQDDPLRRWPGLNFNSTDGWLAQFYWHFLGWLITALAISLGAPFWFDLLNKFIVVRSTVKPHEKSREEGSK